MFRKAAGIACLRFILILTATQIMWATLLFSGTAVLFLAMALGALWHLRWARRLPALEMLTARIASLC